MGKKRSPHLFRAQPHFIPRPITIISHVLRIPHRAVRGPVVAYRPISVSISCAQRRIHRRRCPICSAIPIIFRALRPRIARAVPLVRSHRAQVLRFCRLICATTSRIRRNSPKIRRRQLHRIRRARRRRCLPRRRSPIARVQHRDIRVQVVRRRSFVPGKAGFAPFCCGFIRVSARLFTHPHAYHRDW